VLNDGETGATPTAGDGTEGASAAGGAAIVHFDGLTAATITGTITAAANDEGTIQLTANSSATADIVTITGQVGTSSKKLKLITSGITTAQTGSKFDSDVYAGLINHGLASNWAGDFEMTMDFDGDVTFTTLTATAGTSGTGEDATVDFAKDVTGTTIAIVDANGTGTVHLDFNGGSTGQTVTPNITASASGNGNITINNTAGVAFNGTVGAVGNEVHVLTLAAASKAVFNKAVHAGDLVLTADAATGLTLNAAMTLDSGGDGTGTINLGDGSTIVVGNGFASGATVIAADGAMTDTSGQTINLQMPSDLGDGENLIVIAAAGNGIDATYTAKDTGLFTYTEAVAVGSVTVTAAKRTAAAAAASLGVSEESANSLYSATRAADGDAAVSLAISDILNAGGAAAKEMAEQVQGTPAGLSATSGAATASTGGAVMSVGSARMASLRTGNAYASTFGAGFNAGSSSQDSAMWMKPFASFGDQGERKGIAGYDADTYGIALGADTRLNAHTVVGLSFSYADTDVDGKGAGRSRSEISSYQLTAYADYTEKDWYVEGLVGYALNDMDTSRDIAVTNVKAKGETESDQFMIGLTAGMPTQISPGTYFTPTLGLNITHVVNEAYTETGAGVLNLRVDPEDITIAKASLGGRFHTMIKNADGVFTPEFRARLLYDMAGDDGSSSNTFTGGGAAFNVKGLDVVEFATSVGAGLGYTPSFDTGMHLSVNYDAELKENFTGHSANFTLKYAF
jgi:outer membrane autotransporter protein